MKQSEEEITRRAKPSRRHGCTDIEFALPLGLQLEIEMSGLQLPAEYGERVGLSIVNKIVQTFLKRTHKSYYHQKFTWSMHILNFVDGVPDRKSVV